MILQSISDLEAGEGQLTNLRDTDCHLGSYFSTHRLQGTINIFLPAPTVTSPNSGENYRSREPQEEVRQSIRGQPQGLRGGQASGQRTWRPRPLTDRKAWTMSALMLLRGLSFSTRNICSSLSKEMKFPNQERLASLSGRAWLEACQDGAEV